MPLVLPQHHFMQSPTQAALLIFSPHPHLSATNKQPMPPLPSTHHQEPSYTPLMKLIWTSQASWQRHVTATSYPNLPLSHSFPSTNCTMLAVMSLSLPPQSPSATTTLSFYRVSAHQQQNFGNWMYNSLPPPFMPMPPSVVLPLLTLWPLLMLLSSVQHSPPWRRHSGGAMSLNLPDSLC